jgi:hypothetical protein
MLPDYLKLLDDLVSVLRALRVLGQQLVLHPGVEELLDEGHWQAFLNLRLVKLQSQSITYRISSTNLLSILD